MMTVSAVARLMPRPPARVDSRKQKSLRKMTKPTSCYDSNNLRHNIGQDLQCGMTLQYIFKNKNIFVLTKYFLVIIILFCGFF